MARNRQAQNFIDMIKAVNEYVLANTRSGITSIYETASGVSKLEKLMEFAENFYREYFTKQSFYRDDLYELYETLHSVYKKSLRTSLDSWTKSLATYKAAVLAQIKLTASNLSSLLKAIKNTNTTSEEELTERLRIAKDLETIDEFLKQFKEDYLHDTIESIYPNYFELKAAGKI